MRGQDCRNGPRPAGVTVASVEDQKKHGKGGQPGSSSEGHPCTSWSKAGQRHLLGKKIVRRVAQDSTGEREGLRTAKGEGPKKQGDHAPSGANDRPGKLLCPPKEVRELTGKTRKVRGGERGRSLRFLHGETGAIAESLRIWLDALFNTGPCSKKRVTNPLYCRSDTQKAEFLALQGCGVPLEQRWRDQQGSRARPREGWEGSKSQDSASNNPASRTVAREVRKKVVVKN